MKIFYYIAFIFILIFAVLGFRKHQSSNRPIQFFDNMQNQNVLIPQGQNSFFEDGMNDRKIPANTKKYIESQKTLPICDPLDGKILYDNFCSVCHGEKGDGEGRMKTEYKMLNISSLLAENILKQSDEEIYGTLKNGKNTMLPQGRNFSDEEISMLIEYVRVLQKGVK